MRIQNNVPALNAHRHYGINQTNTQKSIAKLSSGYRINSAADDAAGLAISEKMRAQIRGLTMASKNTQDGISLIQTAEGGMQEIDNMLQRIRELTVYASNDTQEHNKLGTGDRQKIQDEIDQLVAEIDSMAERVEFNKKKLISGEFAGSGAVSSQAIKRLQAQLQEAGLAKGEAIAELNKAGNAYEDFTNKTAGKPLYDAIEKFFGTSAVITASGGWTDVSGTDLSGVLTQAAYASYAGVPSVPGAAYTQYKALVSAINSAAAGISGLGAGYTGVFASIDPNADPKLYDFQTFLSGIGINNIGALTGIAASNNSGGWAPGATLGALFALDPFATGTSNVFKNSDSLEDLRAIANYVPADGGIATGSIAGIVDAAKKVVDAVDKFNEFTAEDGAFDTAKKAYEAAAKAEQDLYKGVQDKQNALAVARSEEQVAQANLAAAIAKGVSPVSGEGLYFQVGANANQSLQLTIGSIKSDTLGIGDGEGKTSIDVLKATGAKITNQLDVLDEALSYVTTERSKLGAAQNRLEYTMNSLEISAENLQSAESRIRDVDMAKEMTNFTKQNILFQASIAMLAQANAFPQGVLQLLG